MQKVNLKKKIIIFSLFCLRFCFGPQVCIGNSSLSICASAWWCQKHNLTSHTHTSYFLSTPLINFLFTHSLFTQHTITNRARTPFVMFQCTDLFFHFQYVFHEGESIISTYVLTPSRKRVTTTEIFQRLSKNA